MRQRTVHQQPEEAVTGPVPASGGRGAPQAAVAPLVSRAKVPDLGSRFSDEGLRARLGVPLRGGIRVSHENKCIVIVDRTDGDRYRTAVDILARYMGGDSGADRALEGANLDLALSRVRGYTVLGFARDGDALVFDGLGVRLVPL